VEQIDTLMNDRASQIDSLIVRAQSKMEKIEAQLTKAQRMLKLQASRDRSASKQLKLNVIEYKKQVARYERQIERNLQKREDVLSSFQQDRLRFVELKTQIAERKRAEALLDY
jgi:Skp family chaperone for outer membrane proteins